MENLTLYMFLALAVIIGLLVLVRYAVEAEGRIVDKIFAERMKLLESDNE